MIGVKFELKDAPINHGEHLYVVGNLPELGDWDVSKLWIEFTNYVYSHLKE